MEIFLMSIYVIIALVIIVLCFAQSKQDDGASAAIMGGSKDSFYEKNKGRTKEARIDNAIMLLFGIFVLISIALYFV